MLDGLMTVMCTDAPIQAALDCGVTNATTGSTQTISPITGLPLYSIDPITDVAAAVARSVDAAAKWRKVPAPVRGKLLHRYSELLTQHRDALATIITAEVGKVPAEARGEVDEIIEMCQLAVGLSHQLYGRTMPSGRPGFRLMETFQPVGPVAIISPFNFPAAAWGWSAPLALVCGNPLLWKPSPLTPVTAKACSELLAQASRDVGAPQDLCLVLPGGPDTATALADHSDVSIVNVSGTTATGRALGRIVNDRFGRVNLFLSGNNASVITPSADLDAALSGIVLAATSAAGQRCTSMRRLIVHHSVADELISRITSAFSALRVGDPRQADTQVGPLISKAAFDAMADALSQAQTDGGRILVGGERVETEFPDAYYVRPALVEMPSQSEVVKTETLAPVLYVIRYDDFDTAIKLNNAVPQGFTSSIYTQDQSEAERFLAESDCGVVNINLHTSGAEVGTSFGGDKMTGGGRQCGSDSWQAYMRRVTTAVN